MGDGNTQVKAGARPRGTPREEAPYVWQSAAALDRIRDHIGNDRGASTIAVYVGLTELANDERAASFTAEISRIARRSALSYKATARALDDLKSAGVISIKKQERKHQRKVERLPSTYTLLAFGTQGGRVAPSRGKGLGKRSASSSAESIQEVEGASHHSTKEREAPSSAGIANAGASQPACGADRGAGFLNQF